MFHDTGGYVLFVALLLAASLARAAIHECEARLRLAHRLEIGRFTINNVAIDMEKMQFLNHKIWRSDIVSNIFSDKLVSQPAASTPLAHFTGHLWLLVMAWGSSGHAKHRTVPVDSPDCGDCDGEHKHSPSENPSLTYPHKP